MSKINTDIVIIGAGLTGLSAAYFLKNGNHKILVLEKAENTGGVINTVSSNGFLFESGPNTGVLSTAEIAGLFHELNGSCSLETANSEAKKRYILKNGKWQPLPSGPISAIRTPLFTLYDKFKILGEPFRKPGKDPDETVARMVVRRLGKSFLDYAVDPFVSGVYAGDPEILVTRYALPKLYVLEHDYGSFVRGSIKKAGEPKTEDERKATREVFSVKGGLGNLIKALTGQIGSENIVTGAKNLRVNPAGRKFDVSFEDASGNEIVVNARVVVTTAGSHSLTGILPFLSAEQLKPLTDLKYAAVVQVALGYHRWKGPKPDAFGGLIPSKENRDILGILFPSAIFEGRSPDDGALLSVFLGGIRRPDIIEKSDNEIESIVSKEINSLMNNPDRPDLLKIFRYPHAIPQYELSTGLRLNRIREIQDQYPGLILAGNIRDGIGMADRVRQAKNIALSLRKND